VPVRPGYASRRNAPDPGRHEPTNRQEIHLANAPN